MGRLGRHQREEGTSRGNYCSRPTDNRRLVQGAATGRPGCADVVRVGVIHVHQQVWRPPSFVPSPDGDQGLRRVRGCPRVATGAHGNPTRGSVGLWGSTVLCDLRDCWMLNRGPVVHSAGVSTAWAALQRESEPAGDLATGESCKTRGPVSQVQQRLLCQSPSAELRAQ